MLLKCDHFWNRISMDTYTDDIDFGLIIFCMFHMLMLDGVVIVVWFDVAAFVVVTQFLLSILFLKGSIVDITLTKYTLSSGKNLSKDAIPVLIPMHYGLSNGNREFQNL